jgi:short-subunit dehydrogenase
VAEPIVLVTGASSGIGEALARRIARDRKNLVLAARRIERLERLGTAGRFDRLPVERELEEIRVNVKAPVDLTGRLLPGMVARGRGVVMNVASMAGFGPMPYTATYGATKAFLLSFSEALAVEVSGTGVHVVCVCPGFTRTKFQEKAKVDASMLPSFAWMSAETVADQAVRAARRSGVLVNGTMNSLTTVVMRLAPRSLVARVAAAAMRGGV